MSANPKLSIAEFVAWEERQEAKHELVHGRVVAFAGGSLAHSFLATALLQRIAPAALPCRTSNSDVLLQTVAGLRYPDVMVLCEESDPQTRVVRRPKLVIEVLSESTASVDRGEKLDEYRSIETLQEYVLIDSRKPWVESFLRVGSDWIASLPVTIGDFKLESIGLTLNLDALYEHAGVKRSDVE